MALKRGNRHSKISDYERSLKRTASIVVGCRMPLYAKLAMEKYIVAFNRENPGAGMSINRLTTALVEEFLRKKGLLDYELDLTD